MAESAVIGNDQGNCEWLRVCSLCKKEIREGTTSHKIEPDLHCCSYCWCD